MKLLPWNLDFSSCSDSLPRRTVYGDKVACSEDALNHALPAVECFHRPSLISATGERRVQHDERDTPRRAGSSASAATCAVRDSHLVVVGERE